MSCGVSLVTAKRPQVVHTENCPRPSGELLLQVHSPFVPFPMLIGLAHMAKGVFIMPAPFNSKKWAHLKEVIIKLRGVDCDGPAPGAIPNVKATFEEWKVAYLRKRGFTGKFSMAEGVLTTSAICRKHLIGEEMQEGTEDQRGDQIASNSLASPPVPPSVDSPLSAQAGITPPITVPEKLLDLATKLHQDPRTARVLEESINFVGRFGTAALEEVIQEVSLHTSTYPQTLTLKIVRSDSSAHDGWQSAKPNNTKSRCKPCVNFVISLQVNNGSL